MFKTIGTLLATLAIFIFAAPGAFAQDEGGKKRGKHKIERRDEGKRKGKKKGKKGGKKGHKKHGGKGCKKHRR